MSWHARALTTFECELSTNADIMEHVSVRAETILLCQLTLSGKIFLKSEPAWSHADSGMLCSTRNDANCNSECITSVDRSTPANNDNDAAFKYFCVAQCYIRPLRPPWLASNADITTAQITESWSIAKHRLSYTLKLVTVLNFKPLFVINMLSSLLRSFCHSVYIKL